MKNFQGDNIFEIGTIGTASISIHMQNAFLLQNTHHLKIIVLDLLLESSFVEMFEIQFN